MVQQDKGFYISYINVKCSVSDAYFNINNYLNKEITHILNLHCLLRVKLKVDVFTLQHCKNWAHPQQLPCTHLKGSPVLCRELMTHLSLGLPSGTFFHWFCQGHSWSSRASHSWPSQQPTDPSWQTALHFWVPAAFSHLSGCQNTQCDIEINTRLVVRSRTCGDRTHHVKHSMVLAQFSCDTV